MFALLLRHTRILQYKLLTSESAFWMLGTLLAFGKHPAAWEYKIVWPPRSSCRQLHLWSVSFLASIFLSTFSANLCSFTFIYFSDQAKIRFWSAIGHKRGIQRLEGWKLIDADGLGTAK